MLVAEGEKWPDCQLRLGNKVWGYEITGADKEGWSAVKAISPNDPKPRRSPRRGFFNVACGHWVTGAEPRSS